MATDQAFLDFVLEQLSRLDGLRFRPMMGEYVLYFQGKTVGGVYDDRLLLKPTGTARALMEASAFGLRWEIPYPGAKELLLADVDDRELCGRVLRAVAAELPMPKRRKRKES